MTDSDTLAFRLRGSNTMLMGPAGAGKTWSLATLVEAGLELACVFTEPGGHESLLAALDARGLPNDKVHWHYVAPAVPSWDDMIASANTISKLSYKGLTEIKAGVNKSAYTQFIDLLNCFADFTDDRTGESLGAVDDWGPERALVVDGLSGMNLMSLDLMVGSKPVKHEGEWGVAMDNEERLIQKLCNDTKCFFVLITHVHRQFNEQTGELTKQADALGKRLAPKLPRWFSDVVYAYKEGKDFYWSTAELDVDLKNRLLPIEAKMEPSFVPIVEEWNRLLELAKADEGEEAA
jgi:hypothetical protein